MSPALEAAFRLYCRQAEVGKVIEHLRHEDEVLPVHMRPGYTRRKFGDRHQGVARPVRYGRKTYKTIQALATAQHVSKRMVYWWIDTGRAKWVEKAGR